MGSFPWEDLFLGKWFRTFPKYSRSHLSVGPLNPIKIVKTTFPVKRGEPDLRNYVQDIETSLRLTSKVSSLFLVRDNSRVRRRFCKKLFLSISTDPKETQEHSIRKVSSIIKSYYDRILIYDSLRFYGPSLPSCFLRFI